MLDGQRQGVDIPVHARTAHNGLLQKKKKKRLEEDLDDPISQRVVLNWTTRKT